MGQWYILLLGMPNMDNTTLNLKKNKYVCLTISGFADGLWALQINFLLKHKKTFRLFFIFLCVYRVGHRKVYGNNDIVWHLK